MSIREQIEEREKQFLSSYATLAAKSLGRAVPEKKDRIRTAFQRDRDRIIHSRAFRRLKHKTQVFIAPIDDHYRTRLTHTIEVSQIARTIARALRLNEDLVEAICLGHDLGHTPFGHTGERALGKLMSKYFGVNFKHNEQSLRVVEKLERNGKGLNLTFEVRDGILNHPHWTRAPKTLEGYIARISDRIAYINHDIEDAVTAKIITKDDLPKEYINVIGVRSFDVIINDVIEQSMDKPYIKMSPNVEKSVKGLYSFMFQSIYYYKKAQEETIKANNLIEALFKYYIDNPGQILQKHNRNLNKKQFGGAIADFIAGMTDRFAINKFNEIYIPGPFGV